jgi:DNA processing protein
MELTKELILTLRSLSGIGPKKILTIGATIKDRGVNIDSLESLQKLMTSIKDKKIQSVKLDDLEIAYKKAMDTIQYSEANEIGLIGYYDDEYPKVLRKAINEEGKLDPPLLLWYRGDISVLTMPAIAVIGTREATPEGVLGGEYLSGEFAKRGFNIVSGLAVGCDTCGHKGALKVGGKTTAILANGLDHESIYPPENQDLAEEIVQKGGLLLSEYPIKSTVNRYNLVARDRLQAGLSLATLVVQTGIKGGTMHAANTTLLAQKELFVMRFKNEATNNHEKCQGNAYLYGKGAKYIKGSDDIDKISEDIKNKKVVETDLFESV